jgi:hypothetical protein
MIELNSYRTSIQGTFLALSRVEGAPHKPFGLELRAERFTPMPDVHIALAADS